MKNVKWLSLVLALVLCLFALPAQAEVQMETHTAVPAIDLPDNDELFAGYVEKQLYADLYGGISTFGTGAYSAGSRLEGTAAFIYEKLAAEVKDIAANGTGTADTIFTFGVTINTADGELVPDYACTITEADSSFVDLALKALVTDHPYEMYWFDMGTVGYKYSTYSDGTTIYVVEVYLAVAPAYQNGAQYTVSAASTKVQAAVAKAQDIVAAAEGMDDEAKLTYYAKQIMELTSYNSEAASVTYTEGYGDPWQLIYVFDGDSSTNVVCEGYAKAFQYLCDLSTFDDAVCYTVSGVMSAPDESGLMGAGDHMWNIVTLDGVNYLVDVTNSDEGTVGESGSLFMARPTSGSVENGYTFVGDNNTEIDFTYDPDLIWGADVLTLVPENAVASITLDGVTTYYSVLSDGHAEDAIPTWAVNGGVLTLYVDASDETFYLHEGVTGTLDLNGYAGGAVSIAPNCHFTVKNGTLSVLIVYDSTGTETVALVDVAVNTTENYGVAAGTAKLTIEGGSISASYPIKGSNVTIKGNTVLTNTAGIDIWLQGGTLDVSGATNCAGWVVYNDSSSTLDISAISLPNGYILVDCNDPQGALTEITEWQMAKILNHGAACAFSEWELSDADSTQHERVCSVCGATETGDHTPDSTGKCETCGETLHYAHIYNGETKYYVNAQYDCKAWRLQGGTMTLLQDSGTVLYYDGYDSDTGEEIPAANAILDMNGHFAQIEEWASNGCLTVKNGKVNQLYMSGSQVVLQEDAVLGTAENHVFNGGMLDLTDAVCEGATIVNRAGKSLAIGTDILLPEGYCMLVDGQLCDELPEYEYGTIHGACEYGDIQDMGAAHGRVCAVCGQTKDAALHAPANGNVCSCGLTLVAKLEGEGLPATTYFADFAKAAEVWGNSGTTLTLLAKVSYNESITLEEGKTYTFNGGDYTLTFVEDGIIGNAGTLTVNGGTMIGNDNDIIANEGTLIIENCTMTAKAQGASCIWNKGALVIESGSFTGDWAAVTSVMDGSTTMTINGGSFTGKGYGVESDTMILNGGSFTSTNNYPYDYPFPFADVGFLGDVTIGDEFDPGEEGITVLWGVEEGEFRMEASCTLPTGSNLHFFDSEGKIVEQADMELGSVYTLKAHDHAYTYTINDDGLTHDMTCTAGCGADETGVRHTFDATTGVCVCGAKQGASITSGSDETIYADFAKAVEAWTDGTTLTLLDDVEYGSIIELWSGTRTFDGGKYTLTLTCAESAVNNFGTLTIKGGTIEGGDFQGVYNLGTLTVQGGTINAITYGVFNNGTATVEGGSINSKTHGVYTIGGGTTHISGGSISGDDAVVADGGNITIVEDVELSGSEKDICFYTDAGTFDLHECTSAEGLTIYSYNENITIGHTADATVWLPEGYYVFVNGKIVTELAVDGDGTIQRHDHSNKYTDNGDGTHDYGCACGVVSVDNEPHDLADGVCVCGAKAVAQVDGTIYTDFAKALAAWTDGTTLTLLDNVEYGSLILFEDNKTRTFDGGEYTLTLTDEARLENYGTLTIASGTITAEGYQAIQNQYSGMLTIAGGTVSSTRESGTTIMNNGGTLTITGGTVSAMARNGYAIANSGSMTMDDGTIEGYSCISNSGTAVLEGGTVTASTNYALNNSGTATLSGANLSTQGENPVVVCYGDTTISGGALTGNGSDVIRRVEGTLTIEAGTVCDGWPVISAVTDAAIGTDIILPADYYMFVEADEGEKAVTELAASVIGTIRKHGHTYTYTADEDTNTITRACSCGLDTVTAILDVPADDFVYNGEAHHATVMTGAADFDGQITYAQNNQKVEQPINAGDYTATMTWGGVSVSKEFTIAPAPLTAMVGEGSRAYNATTDWIAPLGLEGLVVGDIVEAMAEFTLPGADVGEYTQATVKADPELTGEDAGNYTIAKEDVTFTKGTITKAAADKWSIDVASPQDILVGSGLNEVNKPTTGTGIGGEVVDVTNVTFYTDDTLQTPATDADISSLLEGESITLYYVADAKNYEAATGSLVLNAIDHQHVWTYTADEDTSTITATCSGTIGTCPDAEQSVTLTAPDAAYTGERVEAEVTREGANLTYTLQYAPDAPINAGDYTVTMTVGDKSVSDTFTINPKDISVSASCQFSLAEDTFTYTGEAPELTVKAVDNGVGSYAMQEGTDYTVGTAQVNAGSYKLAVTGKGNYTGTYELDYEITRAPIDAAVITAEGQVYTGGELVPDFTVTLDGKALKHNEDYIFELSHNVDVGNGKIVITGIGNYEGQAEGTFAITASDAQITASADKAAYTYGETITVTATRAVKPATFALRAAPEADQMALFVGDEQISDAVDAVDGTYTMTYDTAGKALNIGENTLRVVYISNGNLKDAEATVTVELNKKELTIAGATATGRVYAQGNKLVGVTGVTLDGIIGTDDVAANLTGVQGTLASDNAGVYTTLALSQLELIGNDNDKDYYTIAADDAVPTDVTISKALLFASEPPTDITLDTYLASADQVAAKLPATAIYTATNGDIVPLDVTWTYTDFDAAPKAVNTFTWTVDASNLTNYELPSFEAGTGTIKVTNTDALPVTLTGTDDSITFDEQPYDVVGMFTVDANAGDAHYEVVSGDAVLNGTKLTVNEVGEIVIRLTTDAHDAYAAAEATATLTVTKADPAVTAPEGLTATYDQTLADVTLPTHDEGTWAWVDEETNVGDAGTRTFAVTFTPTDTTNWNTLTLEAQVTVSKAGTILAMAVFNGETETTTFTYGETITVRARAHRPAVLSLRSFTAPAADQMALFLGNEQISEAVNADENGLYTMTIDTADKALKIGDNTITVQYVGTANVEDAQGVATVTLLKKQLTIVNMTAQSRAYQPENQQVTVTAVELDGKIEGDDVAVGTLTAQVSSANVGTYAEAKLPETVPLVGTDADYYAAVGNVEVPVPQKVSITQATPEATGTGADAGQPAVTPVTEDGKTLADIPLTLPEDAYNVPGTIHWVEGDDTPVEKGKEYAWVFIPEDPNYAPVNGTVVIYPEGEAPVITAPAAAQTLTVVEGETGTMTVTATDADTYQWYINRNDGKGYVAIDGATAASYTTSAVKPENDGFTYYCAVGNAYGESKTPIVTLKVKEKVDVPQTGDEAQLGLWLALMVLSLGGLAYVVMNRKRREN